LILLDTHFVVWLASDDGKLRDAERTLLSETDREIVMSSISFWEIRVKALAQARRGLPAPITVAHALAFADDIGFRIATPDGQDYATALNPALTHTDPFDEMLLTHAQQLGARLLTRDRLLLDHPLALSA
jgi:PIN domain nuclease of toxin-antitoxin system